MRSYLCLTCDRCSKKSGLSTCQTIGAISEYTSERKWKRLLVLLPVCFPSRNCAFFDDLNVSKTSLPFRNSSFCLALSHLCSAARISITRGNARPAASVSRKASLDLRAMKSTADSQYSFRAQYATSASRKGYPWASRFPKFSFCQKNTKGECT